MLHSTTDFSWDFDLPTFETSSQQREQLLNDGYVLLPNALPNDILVYWQELAERLHADALAAHADGNSMTGACVLDGTNGATVIRIDDIHTHDHDAVLNLLSCPALMAVARDFCGQGTVPLQLDILFKHAGPESVIMWHQGAPHPRSFPYLNVGIYLDDADVGDGCLRYVPGTQHELQDIAKLSSEHGWEIPTVVEQPAKAGDILVQDMMVLHGSQVKKADGVRRTIYLELRPVGGIEESGWQSKEWGELRERWMAMVVNRSRSGEWPDEWQPDLTPLKTEAEEFAAISSVHEAPIPAVYASQPVSAANYPFDDAD